MKPETRNHPLPNERRFTRVAHAADRLEPISKLKCDTLSAHLGETWQLDCGIFKDFAYCLRLILLIRSGFLIENRF